MVVSTLGTPSTIEAEADISDSGKYNNNPTGNTLLRATHLNTLVYPLPQTPIKDTKPAGANTVSYVFKVVHKDVPLTPTGLASITAGSSFRFMPGGGELSASNAKENFIVIVNIEFSTIDKTLKKMAASQSGQGSLSGYTPIPGLPTVPSRDVSSSGTIPKGDFTASF